MYSWATLIFIYKIDHLKSLAVYLTGDFKKVSAKLCI